MVVPTSAPFDRWSEIRLGGAPSLVGGGGRPLVVAGSGLHVRAAIGLHSSEQQRRVGKDLQVIAWASKRQEPAAPKLSRGNTGGVAIALWGRGFRCSRALQSRGH